MMFTLSDLYTLLCKYITKACYRDNVCFACSLLFCCYSISIHDSNTRAFLQETIWATTESFLNLSDFFLSAQSFLKVP